MKVWIDIRTGTWGDNFEEIMVVDLDSKELHDAHTDNYSLLAFLEGASDSEIATFGDKYHTLIGWSG